jgi:hypothetical protein
MTIDQLIERLQVIRAEQGADREVLIDPGVESGWALRSIEQAVVAQSLRPLGGPDEVWLRPYV